MGCVAILALPPALLAAYQRYVEMSEQGHRRSLCMDNLKQIGVSIAIYSQSPQPGHEGHGLYPSGTIQNPRLAPADRFGWASLIYLGNDEGCSGCPIVNDEIPWNDPMQQGGEGRNWEMFCPSATRQTTAKPRVPAAYIGIAGLGLDAPAFPKNDPRAGIFGDDRVVAPADVKDGLAQTMMIAESSVTAGPWFAGGRHTVRGLDPARQPYIGIARQFGGNHGEGAMVLMADGAVKYVTDSIAPKVFEAWSTMAGGEKFSAAFRQ